MSTPVLGSNELMKLPLVDRIRYVMSRDKNADAPQKIYRELRKLGAIDSSVLLIDITEEMEMMNGD